MIYYRYISSIHFESNGLQSYFGITFIPHQHMAKDLEDENCLFTYNKVWEFSLELFEILCGFDSANIIPSSWSVSRHEMTIGRVFNSPIWQDRPFKSCKASVYINSQILPNRSIHEGFIDTCLEFYKDQNFRPDEHLDDDPKIFEFLSSNSIKIEKAVASICIAPSFDPYFKVGNVPAIWTQESPFDVSKKIYWLKGIRQSSKGETN